MSAVFITGTDTNIGKTIVSSWLAMHWQADYWKPIQAGLDTESSLGTSVASDSEKVALLAGAWCHPEIYRFKQALSPHLCATLNQTKINFEHFQIPIAERLVIEGAGGVLVPLNANHYVIDLINKFETPVIVVARSTLGTINHTCLTLEALRARNIPIAGVIINGEENEENKKAIEHYGQVKVLAEFPKLEHISPEVLQNIPLPISLHNILLQIEHGNKNF